MTERVGIVVPTIGERPEYLPLALKSIRGAGNAYVILVGRKGFDASQFLKSGLIDEYLDEKAPSLPGKINQGFRSLPADIRFINWLGDDDLLTPGSLEKAVSRLTADDAPAGVYGRCQYINSKGQPLFLNSSGQWAVKLLRFGPQLIPQPGALYRRDSFIQIGELSQDFGMAFDFDMFYSLSKVGKLAYIPETLSSFRWHAGSLAVSRRKQSVSEASQVRKAHLPSFLQPFSELWELPIRLATYVAGKLVSSKYLVS